MELDDKLKNLRDLQYKRGSNDAKLSELRGRRAQLRDEESALRGKLAEEQKDVDRLEGHSLTAFFYAVTGRKDEKLDEERREVYAAALRHDTVTASLRGIAEQIAFLEQEQEKYAHVEEELERVKTEKTAWLKANCREKTERILAHEARIAYLKNQLCELSEAATAGHTAQSTAGDMGKELGSAEGWGTWDLFGGGLVTDLIKHSHLDAAQNSVSTLQQQLGRFKTELADVQLAADTQVNIDGFLLFADYFWDGLISDWFVMDHIRSSQAEIDGVRQRLRETLSRLEAMSSAVHCELAEEEKALDGLVEETI